MYKYLLYPLLLALLCGCGATKQTAVSNTNQAESKEKKPALAKIVEAEDGKWVLVAPGGAVVANVFVQMGSTRPDQFHNGMIRIVGEDGKIGFANDKGIIQIQPSYLAATPFKGSVAAVALPGTGAASTDDAAVGVLTGNEVWGVIGPDGSFFRNPVFHRFFEEKVGDYVYSSPTNTFWIDEDGELHGF